MLASGLIGKYPDGILTPVPAALFHTSATKFLERGCSVRVTVPSPSPSFFAIWRRKSPWRRRSATSLFTQDYPVVNVSGGRIAFSSYENGKRLVYAAAHRRNCVKGA